jgi:hypothetical protein
MGRLAILQMADTPQIESTAVMLRAAGYDEVRYCGEELRRELTRGAGCDTVLAVGQMYALGYDRVVPEIREATVRDLDRADLFVEIKVRNVERITSHWPRLRGRVLYWRVNGAQPEICPKGGDEVNLPCPVATACLWYGTERYRHGRDVSGQRQSTLEHLASRPVTLEEEVELARSIRYHDTESNSYVFWPPYPRSADYTKFDRDKVNGPPNVNYEYSPPFTICHSVRAWGYGPIVSECVDLGVWMYGNNSPAGQIPHVRVANIVATGKALVHLKSVDCPGWALYEALLAGCPVVTGRLLNSRMLAHDLLKHGETCYEFGVPASLEYGRGDMDYPRCLEDIKVALDRLSDPQENRRVGENGRRRLNQLMWSDRNPDNVRTFREFMGRHFR